MVAEQGVDKADIPSLMAIQNDRHWIDEFVEALNDADK